MPSFWVRKNGQEKPSSARAALNAAMVLSASGLRDSLRMAAFSLSSKPNIPSYRWTSTKTDRQTEFAQCNLGTGNSTNVSKGNYVIFKV